MPRLADAEWDEAVRSALAELPGMFRKAMENVSIQVSDAYEEEDGEILFGLFDGTPLTEQIGGDVPQLPGRLLLYRRNLEEACGTRAELIREIRVTIFHEIGHALGFEEDELDDLGFG